MIGMTVTRAVDRRPTPPPPFDFRSGPPDSSAAAAAMNIIAGRDRRCRRALRLGGGGRWWRRGQIPVRVGEIGVAIGPAPAPRKCPISSGASELILSLVHPTRPL
ncbi:hypothetical protein NL676_008986 [Syzygium grande]|nr:hypothetical protein NL676_008986 [Syzygium grande]